MELLISNPNNDVRIKIFKLIRNLVACNKSQAEAVMRNSKIIKEVLETFSNSNSEIMKDLILSIFSNLVRKAPSN